MGWHFFFSIIFVSLRFDGMSSIFNVQRNFFIKSKQGKFYFKQDFIPFLCSQVLTQIFLSNLKKYLTLHSEKNNIFHFVFQEFWPSVGCSYRTWNLSIQNCSKPKDNWWQCHWRLHWQQAWTYEYEDCYRGFVYFVITIISCNVFPLSLAQ